MNRLLIPAFCLLTFAAGLGVGLMTRGGAEPGLAYSPELDEPQCGCAEQASGPEKPAGKSSRPAPHAAPDSPPAATQPDLARIIESVEAGDPPRGEGVITGKVTDTEGDPLKGAQLLAWPRAPWSAAGGWREGDGPQPVVEIESETRKQIGLAKRKAKSRREVWTDSEGRYRFEGLADGKYEVYAYAKGFQLVHADSTQSVGVAIGASVDFIAEVLATVSLDVRKPDGSRPENAKIEVTPEGKRKPSQTPWWSPKGSNLRLQPGRYTLRAYAGEDNEYRSDLRDVFVKSGGETAKVTLQLKSRTGVRGEVKIPASGYHNNLEVFIARYRGEWKPDVRALKATRTGVFAHRGNGFRFEFWDMKPGRYLLAGVIDKTVVAEATVDIDGRLVQDLQVPALKREDYVVVHIYGPDDEPVKNPTFMAGYRNNDRPLSNRACDAIRQADGSFWIRHPLAPDFNVEGKLIYTVSVKVSGLGAQTVEYERRKGAEVEVRFRKPAFLEVTIVGYEGSKLDGEIYLILGRYRVVDFGAHRHNRSNGRGTFKIGPIEPGPCSFVICIPQKYGKGLELATHALDVRAGENSLTVPLPKLNPLTVSARGAIAGKYVGLSLGGGGGKEFETYLRAILEKDYTATFQHVPAGPCTIIVTFREGDVAISKSMKINIPEQSNVIFAPDS